MALYASVAGAAGAGRGGRGGRSIRDETRTCWYCFQVGHLKADCHMRQLIQRHRAIMLQHPIPPPLWPPRCRPACYYYSRSPSWHYSRWRRQSPYRQCSCYQAPFPPSLLAQAHAILAEPRKNISRRN
ncbi:hypothetical protein N7489_005430, partial [Penicillium chrysogenum]|uniref:uncharacterized protein n=1 Tax=Penicillium chrysogenum TaxID=5076 RepID=UPI0024DF2713